jgi:hypothetical protein
LWWRAVVVVQMEAPAEVAVVVPVDSAQEPDFL